MVPAVIVSYTHRGGGYVLCLLVHRQLAAGDE